MADKICMRIRKFIEASPGLCLITAGQRVARHMDRFLKTEGMNFLQALVLTALFFEPERQARPRQLSKAFGTTKGNISHCLNSLHRQRLIERVSLDRDARGFLITLTAKGEKTCLRLIGYF